MSKRRTGDEITRLLKDFDRDLAKGLTVEDVCRKHGVAVNTYYRCVRVANPILQGLVAFPGDKFLSPGAIREQSIGKKRDPAKEQLWRRRIADQARCGLSMRAYCQREGLKECNFQWWRRELARRDRQGRFVPNRERAQSPAGRTPTSAFLPVQVVADASVPSAEVSDIEIVLPLGPVVRVTRGFDPRALDAVLSVLEARRC